MSWYEYHQNNSGGYYEGPAEVVWIEAASPAAADGIAEREGLYFDGCASGRDCSCCGDRWYRTDDYEASSAPVYHHRDPDGEWNDYIITQLEPVYGVTEHPHQYGWGDEPTKVLVVPSLYEIS